MSTSPALPALAMTALRRARAGEHQLLTYRQPGAIEDGRCGLVLATSGAAAAVVISQLPDNPGQSVTNAIEHLATRIYCEQLAGVDPRNIAWVERYEKSVDGGESVALVRLGYAYGRGNDVTFYDPKWQYISNAD